MAAQRISPLLASMREPWTLLASAFGGGVVWAAGNQVAVSAALTSVMYLCAVAVGTFTRPSHPVTGLRPGTRQQELTDLFDEHLRSLATLQVGNPPEFVAVQADNALAAARSARPSVLRLAMAVDTLDDAIASARRVAGQREHATSSIRMTIRRLRTRRTELLDRLAGAVDEVATVYAGLLELSATARTMGVESADGDVTAVNESVTLLRMTFAELDADAARGQGAHWSSMDQV